jgi:hypothetical protein
LCALHHPFDQVKDWKNGLLATSKNQKLKIRVENGNFWAGKTDISISEKGYIFLVFPIQGSPPTSLLSPFSFH